MTMFKLNEPKLRAAFADEDFGIEPFDPVHILADELHALLVDCLDQDVIETRDPNASIAIYPLADSEPTPILAVNPGEGPTLLGGTVGLSIADRVEGEEVRQSIVALRALVEDANALFAESEIAEIGFKDGGSEQCCENCGREHGPLRACLLGVLAGCVEQRGSIEPISAAELASIAVDPLWDRYIGPAVDEFEALLVAARAGGEEGS